jgi:iron complex transport system substrate-binding protein
VALRRPVARVVTLAPNVTELVAAIGAEHLLVGVDDSSNHPPSVEQLPDVGAATPSIERIVALRPDLVIGRTNGSHPSLAPALEAAGVPLFLVRTEDLADIPNAMSRLGEVLRIEGAAESRARFEEALASQKRERDPRPRVLVVVWPDPLYIAARGNYADDLLELTGAENAVGPDVRGWPQLSIEPLLASSPDLIIHPDSIDAAMVNALFTRDVRWRNVEAVKKGMIFPVDEDLFFRQGPRLADAARSLNEILDRWERTR